MNTALILYQQKTRHTLFGIGVLWLFHLCAIIGISLGYFEFFVPKTPLNLTIQFVLTLWILPVDTSRKGWLTALFFAAGMLVEWIGVKYGFLFGEYYYGSNLGPKLDGVPFLIGINWAVLVLVTGVIANRFFQSVFLRVLAGAALMVFLDFFMEPTAPIFDFWVFENGIAPLRNYLAWFGIAAVLHSLFQLFRFKGNSIFALQLYLCQLVFFAYFFLIHHFA